jgi:carbonic anhydrase
VFVHRNVANVVVPSDLNALSVIQFAVEHLRVEHIMVVGHYGCGGVKAAMSQNSFGIINKWLRNIKDVYRIHREEFYSIAEESKRVDRLIELNVMEQVMNLAKTSIIQEAWKDRQGPHLHGWVYGLADGIIKPIMEMEPGSRIDPIYEFDNL